MTCPAASDEGGGMIFGSQDNQQDASATPAGAPTNNSFIVGTQAPADDGSLSAAPADDAAAVNGLEDTASAPAIDPVAAQTPWPDAGLSDETEAASTDEQPVVQPADVDEIDDDTPAAPVLVQPHGDDLLVLKQQALNDLGPLIDHLDQSPEEKFRTTMMMIQSTDNQALLKEAYAAAQAIPDDKVRAQALLDVVNEINYFTQHAPAADQE